MIGKKMMIAWMLTLAAVGLCGGTGPLKGDAAEWLHRPLADDQAVVWYLGHSGFAVKTKSKLLIFDYVDNLPVRNMAAVEAPSQRSLDNGWINPEEFKDLTVVVFVSHSHGDHYDRIIEEWRKAVPDIHYVFGWEESREERHHSLLAPRSSLNLDGIQVWTVNSHHSGVPESAFLIQVDGLCLFHAGDYMGRMGDDKEPVRVPDDMRYLRSCYSGPVDILFMLASASFEPNRQILSGLQPRVILPMHSGRREERYLTFADELKASGIDIPVGMPRNRGDRFLYKNGRLEPLPKPDGGAGFPADRPPVLIP